jgi:hypothetical protein
MTRNACFALLILVTVAACSRSAEPDQPSVEPCSQPANACAKPKQADPPEDVKDGEPEKTTTEGGFQADKRSSPLPRGYSRELKLLYIEQGFRHEARFLNENLKRDKGLAYQGFFIEAQDGWTQPTSNWSEEVKKQVKPLRRPFWADGKIIEDEAVFIAAKYDVVIIGDVNSTSPTWREEYWDWLATWVEAGGGLILLSGQAHHPSDYGNLEAYKSLSPLKLDAPATPDQLINRGVEKYFGRTAAGRKHQILRLDADEARDDELWGVENAGQFQPGDLHGMYWYALAGEPKEDATVLARVAKPDGKIADGAPLIITRNHGKGRVLWLGTEDFHYWRQWVGEHYFYKFWQNAIRWAANDPGKKPD